MIKEIRIHVEGGGDGKETRASIRTGFGEFLRELRQLARSQNPTVRWKIIACGSRNDAFDSFRHAVAILSNAGVFVVLLVDAEGPVARETSAWDHLSQRDEHWQRPDRDRNDARYQLMAQTMEAWFVADPQSWGSSTGKDSTQTRFPERQTWSRSPKTRSRMP